MEPPVESERSMCLEHSGRGAIGNLSTLRADVSLCIAIADGQSNTLHFLITCLLGRVAL